MTEKTKDTEAIARRAGDLMRSGFSCSESIIRAVGDDLLDEVHESLLRASTAFTGGIGSSFQGLCGALSGGVMAIGAKYGRLSVEENKDLCSRLAAAYQNRFTEKFGNSICGVLREKGYGTQTPCAVLVEQATELLLEILMQEADS